MQLDLEYYVIASDYKNYAVTFACGTIPVVGAVQMVWIYGRNRTMSQTFIDQALGDLKANNITATNLVDVDQKSCDKN